MRKRVLSILLALSVILAYVPMMGITAVAEGEVDKTPLTFTSDQPFSVTIETPVWCNIIEYTKYNESTEKVEWEVWDANDEEMVWPDKIDAIEVSTGKYEIKFKGYNGAISPNGKSWKITNFDEGTEVSISGNIMTLLDADNPALSMDVEEDADEGVFKSLFANNSCITDASQLKLPATTLSRYCYNEMFKGCTSLTEAPELPATELAYCCYQSMFDGCTSLTEAPELPSTELAENCYNEMFKGCTSLTEAPELPATELAENCYNGMFKGCTSLTEAPELPSTIMSFGCYQSMFDGCTSLTEAPELPATELADSCYWRMFKGCTSLTEAPELPADELIEYCYVSMFEGCSNLVKSPNLPATSLTEYCYYRMFYGCTSLTELPELQATNLELGCYELMFWNCKKIKLYEKEEYVEANYVAKSWSIPAVAKKWIDAFEEEMEEPSDWNKEMFSGTGGGFTGSPEPGVTYYYACEQSPITGNVDGALTFTSDSKFSVKIENPGWDNKIYYRTGTNDWHTWDKDTSNKVVRSDVGVSGKQEIQFVGDGNSVISSNDKPWKIIGGTNVNVLGNIMTLLDYDNPATLLENPESEDDEVSNASAFSNLFANNSCITDASQLKLPATVLSLLCYNGMFRGCTSLTKAPELPATTLADGCYMEMFSGCSSLKEAPKLPATTLGMECYCGMFAGCTSLKKAPELPARDLYGYYYCYSAMFMGCTNLTEAPDLPATTLIGGCYAAMFQDCISLTKAPELPATTFVKEDEECYMQMFAGCTSLKEAPKLPATTLADMCYKSMFQGCENLVKLPKLEATTLAEDCYAEMFSGCTSIKLTSEQLDNSETWSIPAAAQNWINAYEEEEGDSSDWNKDMLKGTGGTFSGDPVAGTTYRYLPEGKTYNNNDSITITQQPSASNGYTVNVKVESESESGYSIEYQWYSKKPNDIMTDTYYEFKEIAGNTTNVLSADKQDGYTYYCKCTATKGDTKLEVDSNRVVYNAVAATTPVNTPDSIPAAMKNATYYASLTLGDNIDVNLTIKDLTSEFEKEKLSISVDGNQLNGSGIKVDEQGNVKCVLCSKAPQDADETFSVQIKYGDDVVKVFDYKVRNYCRNLLAKEETIKAKDNGVELINLCKAFLYYSSCADLCNAGDGTDFVDDKALYLASLENTTIKPLLEVQNPRGSYAEASLTIDSGISINLYIKSDVEITDSNIQIWNNENDYVNPDNITVEDATIKINDKDTKVKKITIKNIGASKLSREYRVSIDDGPVIFDYGVYNYLKARYDALNKEETKTTQITNEMNFLQAMYIYGEAAKKYYAALK